MSASVKSATRAPRRPGRPPGTSGTRAAILQAARHEFADAPFDRATIRAIAARAGVDPALIRHYFGSKDQLFQAALQPPLTPASFVPQLLASDRDHIGELVVRRFLSIWEEPSNRPIMTALVRSAVSDSRAADMVRDILAREVFQPLAMVLSTADAPLRATLAGSQLIGLALMRYVVRLEPLVSTNRETLIALVGPTIQRYLFAEPPCPAEPVSVNHDLS